MAKGDILLSVNVMVSFNNFNVLTRWAQLVYCFLQDVKFSPIVIDRSKFRRMDSGLQLKLKLHQLWRIGEFAL